MSITINLIRTDVGKCFITGGNGENISHLYFDRKHPKQIYGNEEWYEVYQYPKIVEKRKTYDISYNTVFMIKQNMIASFIEVDVTINEIASITNYMECPEISYLDSDDEKITYLHLKYDRLITSIIPPFLRYVCPCSLPSWVLYYIIKGDIWQNRHLGIVLKSDDYEEDRDMISIRGNKCNMVFTLISGKCYINGEMLKEITASNIFQLKEKIDMILDEIKRRVSS